MICTIVFSVYLILMIFIAFMVNSFMYYAGITALTTTYHPGDPETPFSAVTARRKILYVSTLFLTFEI